MKTSLIGAVVAIVGAASPAPVVAQSYPIDCAILLCLAGGWPASVPCTRAKAEFIRRITPWPVEPPLQIWRCPMHAAFRIGPDDLAAEWHNEIAGNQDNMPQQSFAARPAEVSIRPSLGEKETSEPAVLRLTRATRVREAAVQLAQAATTGSADIDISGSEFDFVRSIKVWHVEYRHFENRNGDCNEYDRTLFGSYGRQGDYRWARSSAHVAPAWMGINLACTRQGGMFRTVGVEWIDHLGNAGHELVRY